MEGHARLQLSLHGRVQGVGFRYTCKRIAQGFEVAGWVRNLADGRVELQCSGAREEVEGFLEAIAESMMAADAKGGAEETKMLADHKAADDAAIAKLIAGAKSNCKTDIS